MVLSAVEIYDRAFDGGLRPDPLLRVTLGHLHRGQHRQHGAWSLVDHIANPVVATLGNANLRALHDHHPLDRRGRREAIHDLAQIWCSACAPWSRLRCRLA